MASKTVVNEEKEQKYGFSGMFLGTLGASLFRDMLTGIGFVRTRTGM